MRNTINHEERVRTEISTMFQQVDVSLHTLLDYLDPATPDFDTDIAISRWERFARLQRRHSLALASRPAGLLASPHSVSDTPDVAVAKHSAETLPAAAL